MIGKKHIDSIGKMLKEYNALNFHVLESMADWVRVVDYDGNILYANKAMKESLGDNIVGKKCYEVYVNKEPCGFCISKRSIETKDTIQKEEIINGKYFSVKSSPVLDLNGEAIAAVEVFRDVTRERKLELELIEKNKKMSKDLLFAKRLQERILPKKGIYGTLKIDHLYKPCEMLSGDMFDIYHIDEENIGIYICDVVGHGVTASMMTMFVRQTMRAIKDDILNPGSALTELHKRFVTLNLDVDKYFTIFYGVYNIRTNQFKYSNAGHNCIPIIFNDYETTLIKTKGFPISLIFNDIHYEENQIQLNKGDKVLFYTDGITEVRNIDGEEFGVERLVDVVNEHKIQVLDIIVEEVEKFRWGEQEDDFAIVLVEVIE
ncbi:sigma-B regulation protein RsbU (phosphoserine phosphatase) [Keratinibaculum paraultunense]|uniref:Sigma-B regulation protein RsbU (Phosphoserine phosphatase) n=1 Tax=Keratinibaculum paraultunense TaxID=1278232 RepID=A0A4R3KVU7_9FIRM|nr:SpoIIE family protein phosphatase [Keratinibaculum paraultunense]QQY79506.1 SpoIIE family protein phosphatase [Keratinibaculum paraultunense]TCS87999.1 sigma-B regulation protein RsbU (phosphoserine phosphatase) [Keratinibaculum paraultunense]